MTLGRQATESAYQDVITELVAAGLLSPRPKMMGFRAWSMLLPSVAQSVGLCCFGVVAWSFTEMGMLDMSYRINLVVIGSFLIAAGGSIGSLPVTVELYRKQRNGGWQWFDWAAMIFSPIASLIETVTALSFLGGFEISQNIGRIILLAVLGTLDTCLGMAELGDYLGSYDQRLNQWKREYRRAVREYTGNVQQQQPAQTYQVPTGDYAHTPKLPEQKLGTPESNGNGGYCWCGKWCDNSHVYPTHIRHDHIAETLYDPVNGDRYGSSATARNAMLERYKDTMDKSNWPFPSLDKVNEMRRSKTAQKIQEKMRRTVE